LLTSILLKIKDCCLILYHPYRPLIQFVSDLCPDDTTLLQVAWRIANDCLRTDASLMFPPSLIALTCLHISCVIQKKDAKQWFSELNVDMEKIFEITRHILYFYEVYKSYNEKEQIKDILSRISKPRVANSANSVNSQQTSSQKTSSSQPNEMKI
jgi:cyclin-C